jgi:hypothetical protein
MRRTGFATGGLCVLALAGAVGFVSQAAGQDKGKALPAEELTKAFAADEKAAKAKYNDKPVLVEGAVLARTEKGATLVTVTLKGHAKKGGGTYKVECRFAFTEEEEVLKVKPGDKVKIQGESLGGLTGKEGGVGNDTVALVMCQFVK